MFPLLNSHLGLVAPIGQPRSGASQAQTHPPSSWGFPGESNKQSVYERYVRHHKLSGAVCDSLQNPTQDLTLKRAFPSGANLVPLATLLWVHLQNERVTSAVEAEAVSS